MDTLTPKERSELMTRIRSRRNASTELRLAELFRKAGIKGWRRHYAAAGHPDFVFLHKKLAIFVDGDFWHGNPAKLRIPKSRVEFWTAKIRGNQARDLKVNEILLSRGWKVLRIWESELSKNPEACVARITSELA